MVKLLKRRYHVEIRNGYGDLVQGRVTGQGAAGSYIEVRGDDGQHYSGYTSDPDCRKLFDS
jgi:hypothetical protein